MGNVIITLGIITYSLIAIAIVFVAIFRVKKKKTYYRLHRGFGIAGIILATVHGLISILYFYGII